MVMTGEMQALWAEETFMAGLRKLPLIGTAVEITQNVAIRREAIETTGRVDKVETELSNFQGRIREIVKETIAESMEVFSQPQIDGKTLNRLINEFRDLNAHEYHTVLFDGLFKSSTHYDELNARPEHYGTLLDDQANFPEGMFPLFIDMDKTRLLAIPPASLSLILSTKKRIESEIVAPGDVWALPRELVAEKSNEPSAEEEIRKKHKSYPVPRLSNLAPFQNIHGWNESKVVELQKRTADLSKFSIVTHDNLSDGGRGPGMVIIPAGQYTMGSPVGEKGRLLNEKQVVVSIEQPFMLGETVVTFREYDHYCQCKNQRKPYDSGWGRGDKPVINVTWDDAIGYCRWLCKQSGKDYRMPSKQEWEYACRAGTITPYWFGEKINPKQANYNKNTGTTVNVKSLPKNSWGLYQMHGNVLEWCSDIRNNSTFFCGGSWSHGENIMRSAYHVSNASSVHGDTLGFRIARVL